MGEGSSLFGLAFGCACVAPVLMIFVVIAESSWRSWFVGIRMYVYCYRDIGYSFLVSRAKRDIRFGSACIESCGRRMAGQKREDGLRHDDV